MVDGTGTGVSPIFPCCAISTNSSQFDYDLNFANPNGGNMDVLQDFDFDSFLHQDGEGVDNFDFNSFGPLDGNEIGAE
jgi:hypothetical protein